MDTQKKNSFILTTVLYFFVSPYFSLADFLPVCDRTHQVKQMIEFFLKKPCQSISEAELLTLHRLSVDDMSNIVIPSFKKEDFSGLKELKILNIRDGSYTHLPEGLFKDLVNLETLVIISTPLQYYPNDFLANHPKIQNLHLFRNSVRAISESVLSRLEVAKNLKVLDFDQALQEAEKRRLQKSFPKGGSVELNFY